MLNTYLRKLAQNCVFNQAKQIDKKKEKMRFIGNKELLAPDIKKLLQEKGLLNKGLKLFDAFCGTGAVSDSLKDSFNIIANDNLSWCVVYCRGRVTASECKFEDLGFDPFDFFNSNEKSTEGFFYQNYSPSGSDRMYFSAENAGRIDYIRQTIDDWKSKSLINEDEFSLLLASLIESVSFVSNTAGVYGAFLKHWDPRARKRIKFKKVQSNPDKAFEPQFHNNKIENIIENIACDVLYIDPPYTQNQYGTQYHLLETLVLNDSPTISSITGSRSTAPMRSDWSKDTKAHILFDQIVSKTKAKYIVFSYSTDGFMSKSYIEAVFKRYGKPQSYSCKKIAYSKYKNFKSRGKKEHFEYLFFVEKKEKAAVRFGSPLNYTGSKTRMLPILKENFPKKIDTFVDAFGGGFNVGINADANRIIYNDYNHIVKELIESFWTNDTLRTPVQ